MDINVDVAIVGYGPGGAVLASLLGQRGHKVAVLEKFPAPYNLPRMSTLDGEISRVLQHAADPAEALKDSVPQPTGSLYGADGKSALVADWSGTLCGHPLHLRLHQPNIEAAMHARVDVCPTVQVHWGHLPPVSRTSVTGPSSPPPGTRTVSRSAWAMPHRHEAVARRPRRCPRCASAVRTPFCTAVGDQAFGGGRERRPDRR